jgi:hypothetical protein
MAMRPLVVYDGGVFQARPLRAAPYPASKQELRDRIMAAIDFFNREPVVHTWTCTLDKAA